MKTTGFLLVAMCVLAISCRENCLKQALKAYQANKQELEMEKNVNRFGLHVSFIPSLVLMRNDIDGKQPSVRDTGYYYFKVQVTAPEESLVVGGNKTSLFYGVDTLFATSAVEPMAHPELVEPINTGSNKRYEYLLVFAKKDYTDKDRVTVVFNDRLFTNTIQVFPFDRKKIDEIETLQCYANED